MVPSNLKVYESKKVFDIVAVCQETSGAINTGNSDLPVSDNIPKGLLLRDKPHSCVPEALTAHWLPCNLY